jgi:hypothetical protein
MSSLENLTDGSAFNAAELTAINPDVLLSVGPLMYELNPE